MTKELPIVIIVGRQNVGKSTLFNALIKDKKAIVDSFPGLTRDIINFSVTYKSVSFVLSDTPGLDLGDPSELSQAILENARRHLARSSVIILLLENPDMLAFDVDLYDIIRKMGMPVIIAVNKMDSERDLENMSNFYEIGCSDILPISAKGRRNIDLLLDKILNVLPVRKTFTEKIDMRMSIVGRPNSGKSTLLNSLIGENRSVVSDIPGTTRDSIDENFSFQGKRIQVIDTAGLHRKSKVKEDIQFYSMTRTIESIKKCDVVVHLIDALAGITVTDQKISDEILKANKPMIIAVNKWDAIGKDQNTFKEYTENLIYKMYRAGDFPIISISAKEKQRIHKLIVKALEITEKARRRIETPKLNKIIETVQKSHAVPLLGGNLKVFYATQIETVPPQFKFFVNNPELFRRDILRFFQKLLQKELDIVGVPVIIHVEGRKRREKSSGAVPNQKKGHRGTETQRIKR